MNRSEFKTSIFNTISFKHFNRNYLFLLISLLVLVASLYFTRYSLQKESNEPFSDLIKVTSCILLTGSIMACLTFLSQVFFGNNTLSLKQKKKDTFWFTIAAHLIVIIVIHTCKNLDQRELRRNHEITFGFVYRDKIDYEGSNVIEYGYMVQGKWYIGEIYDKNNKFDLNDSVKIKYCPSNPRIKKILNE